MQVLHAQRDLACRAEQRARRDALVPARAFPEDLPLVDGLLQRALWGRAGAAVHARQSDQQLTRVQCRVGFWCAWRQRGEGERWKQGHGEQCGKGDQGLWEVAEVSTAFLPRSSAFRRLLWTLPRVFTTHFQRNQAKLVAPPLLPFHCHAPQPPLPRFPSPVQYSSPAAACSCNLLPCAPPSFPTPPPPYQLPAPKLLPTFSHDLHPTPQPLAVPATAPPPPPPPSPSPPVCSAVQRTFTLTLDLVLYPPPSLPPPPTLLPTPSRHPPCRRTP